MTRLPASRGLLSGILPSLIWAIEANTDDVFSGRETAVLMHLFSMWAVCATAKPEGQLPEERLLGRVALTELKELWCPSKESSSQRALLPPPWVLLDWVYQCVVLSYLSSLLPTVLYITFSSPSRTPREGNKQRLKFISCSTLSCGRCRYGMPLTHLFDDCHSHANLRET